MAHMNGKAPAQPIAITGDTLMQLLNGSYDRTTGETTWKLRVYDRQRDSAGTVWNVTGRSFRFVGIRKQPVRDSEGNMSSLYVVPRSGVVSDAVWRLGSYQ